MHKFLPFFYVNPHEFSPSREDGSTAIMLKVYALALLRNHCLENKKKKAVSIFLSKLHELR